MRLKSVCMVVLVAFISFISVSTNSTANESHEKSNSLGVSASTLTATSQIVNSTERINTVAGTFEVNMIRIPRNSNRLEFVTSIANDGKIGFSDTLANLAKQENGVVAINGTFFDAYTDQNHERYPSGALMADGKVLQSSKFGSTVSFSKDGEIAIDRLRMVVRGYINGEYQWYAWRLNSTSASPDAIIIHTPEFSTGKITEEGTKVVVNNEVVQFITESLEVNIPENGYVINFGIGEYPTSLSKRFAIGDKVGYEFETTSPDHNEQIEVSEFIQMVGAGPKLLSKGQVDVDLVKDEMLGNKHTIKAARSFIGYNDDTIIMGTTRNASHEDVAHITKELGMLEAMALDGGASSGLYYEGKYLTQPGRNISNALVVRVLQGPPIYVNNERLSLDSNAYIVNGVSMVPLRGIFEKLEANVQWDSKTKTITINQGDKNILMILDSTVVYVDDKVQQLLKAPEINNGRTHIPLRFVAETLGASVNWDGINYRVDIQIP